MMLDAYTRNKGMEDDMDEVGDDQPTQKIWYIITAWCGRPLNIRRTSEWDGWVTKPSHAKYAFNK